MEELAERIQRRYPDATPEECRELAEMQHRVDSSQVRDIIRIEEERQR